MAAFTNGSTIIEASQRLYGYQSIRSLIMADFATTVPREGTVSGMGFSSFSKAIEGLYERFARWWLATGNMVENVNRRREEHNAVWKKYSCLD
jgi:hypothetical protein